MNMAMHSKLGKSVIASLKEVAGAIESGGLSRLTVRTVKLPADPMSYDAQAVKQTRERLNVSQAVFARLLGISVVLSQAWEQGLRKPSKMACRLLDEINAAPERWRQRLVAA